MRQGHKIPGCLITQATKFCRVQLFLHTKLCIISHILDRRSQIAVRFTGYSRTVGPQYGPCCLLQCFYQESGSSTNIWGKFV